MTTTPFSALPLAEPIQRALRDLSYDTPSPIQEQALPPQLEGRDIIGCAQTGTGKTAAFALPILHHMSQSPDRPVANCARALVLTPTRELAVQVGESFSKYGKYLKLRHCLIYGGVSQKPQVNAMRRGVDILVATPGRLLDLINQGHVDLQRVEFLVLDEVDRMLDMGFVHDVKKIAAMMPSERQTALFTATLNGQVRSVADRFINDPVEIRIDPGKPVVERIDQKVCHVRVEDKLPLLQYYLTEQDGSPSDLRTLVFSRTKHGCDKLSKKLKGFGIVSEAIHGNKTQAARQKALDRFRDGRVSVLVATDVAARGIDVKDIGLVVNFDLPNEADTYVHRIGRTARAETSGRAISFCDEGTTSELFQIERHLGKEIDLERDQPFHYEGMPKSKSGGGKGRGQGGGGRRKRPYGRGGRGDRSGGGGFPGGGRGRSGAAQGSRGPAGAKRKARG
ncbi:DEAD/DEAH box helicase [Puniceicoccus vermicola]|uniref:DEAD-box ATP-dependent RNA helicase RhpA n=1 Tax=Puniceicoccus vermicola TaxID=388746 RepID=A0A7X1AVM3_9BACT|nr:DEAD/DEAH box helicase [Puniceicoccus vermicola]MBC2600820.1 DEAD/DEAH box helicase [Puniceicoccus vermicola]